ncbi:MAG: hypothetical protein M1812_004099 [Candelaria pacifica]|nr:MAG: hypothetical protein M1812_004099 [Candelaria pacifica]
MSGPTHIYSSRGRLSFNPDCPSIGIEAPLRLYRARRSRPQLICVKRVRSGSDLGEIDHISKHISKQFHIVRKLAASRENAKRFFRSVISPSSNPFSRSSVSSSTPSVDSLVPPSTASYQPSSDSSTSSFSVNGRGIMVGLDMARPTTRNNSIVGGPTSGMVHRPSLTESVRTESGRSSVSNGSVGNVDRSMGDEKPVASGNGVSVSIALTEPVLFLQGFEQSNNDNRTTTMLRGYLHLRVTKTAKIKGISLNFRGKAETEWPEGIPPRKTEFRESETIMSHTWPFFNAQFPTAQNGHCADSVQLAHEQTNTAYPKTHLAPSSAKLSSKEQKRLSLQLNQSRSFGKGESATGGPTVAQKGYRTFHPGEYTYNFELPLDSRLPETISVELGTVKYELEASIERAGAFRANLLGSKEVTLIRAPSEGSLEQVEPIAISRNWEDQLHYDIVISGKSFPLGSQIPIAFKLTPLAKVQCHRIKVFITENIEYYTSNKRVHRLEPTRKVQLFEKRADGPSNSAYPGSSVRITAGGGIDYDNREAAASGDERVNRDITNLLGNLEGEHNIGPTEMEFAIQLPSCHSMRDRDKSQHIHFDTTYHNIQVHHWIKIVMRLSRPDATDPSKRRHFEISIDSPFHVLSCRADLANTALPAYSAPQSALESPFNAFECGCPGAARTRTSPNSSFSAPSGLNGSVDGVAAPNGGLPSLSSLTRPQQAHVHDPNSGSVQRPMHLLRSPSFNPPAFEDVEPAPPLITPPPQYDSIVGGGSGLADYFSRLADEYDDEDDGDGGGRAIGRVDVPLTPGGRINRSMDERRAWLPIGQSNG